MLPVGHGRARHRRGERLGRVGDGVESHVAAVRPAGDPDAGGVHAGQRLQVLDTLELVLELDPPEVVEDGLLERLAAARGAPVVERPDEEAAAREKVVEGRDVAPRVRDHLRLGAAVDGDDDRVLPRGIEARRLEQRAVERRAVLRLHLRPLERAALEAEERRRGVVVDGVALLPVLALDPHARRGLCVRPGVRVEAAVRRDEGAVRAVLLRQAGAAGAVEAGAVQVPLAGVLLRRGEVEKAGALVEEQGGGGPRERHGRVHDPGAARDLPAGPGEVARVRVGPAVPLGDPQEAAAAVEEAGLAEVVDPGLRALGEHRARRAERGVGGGGHRQQAQLQLVLRAVQVLEGDAPGVGRERELRQDVDVVGRERDQPLGPGRAVPAEAHHAEPHDRVRRARLGIPLPPDLVAHGEEVHDGERGHPRLVELQVGDLPRVRRPGVSLPRARGELLLVDPVEPAVQQRLRATSRQPGLPAARGVHHPEVAAAHERDLRAVRRGLGVLLLFRRLHERTRGAGPGVDDEDVAAGRHEELAVRHPRRCGERERLRLARPGAAGRRGGRPEHLGPVEEQGLLPGPDVERLDERVLARPADPGEPASVGMPGQAGGHRAGERRLGVDALERQPGQLLREGRSGGGQQQGSGGREAAGDVLGHRGHLRADGARGPRPHAGGPARVLEQGPRTGCR